MFAVSAGNEGGAVSPQAKKRRRSAVAREASSKLLYDDERSRLPAQPGAGKKGSTCLQLAQPAANS